MRPAIAAGPAVSTEPRVPMRATAVAAAESSVTSEARVSVEATASSKITVSAKTLEPFLAANVGAAMKISAPSIATVITAKVSPPVPASEIPVIVSAKVATVISTEVSPVAVTIAIMAPPVAIVKISPTITVVEVDPRRIVEIVVSAIKCRPVESSEPWPGADKHASVKPLGSIVAVRGAIIWRVWIVAVRANRRRSHIADYGADSNADRDAYMRAGWPRRKSRNCDKGSN